MDVEQKLRDVVLQEVILACQAANMPKGFIDAIVMRRVSPTRFVIENKWTKKSPEGEDLPLAVWHERGTRAHWVEPKNAKVLAWKSAGPESGRSRVAIYAQRHDNEKGQWLYSKGHYVSGLPALEPMKRGFRIGLDRLKREIKEAAD